MNFFEEPNNVATTMVKTLETSTGEYREKYKQWRMNVDNFTKAVNEKDFPLPDNEDEQLKLMTEINALSDILEKQGVNVQEINDEILEELGQTESV